MKETFELPQETVKVYNPPDETNLIINKNVTPSLMRQMWNEGYRPEDYDSDVKEMFHCPPDVSLGKWAELMWDSMQKQDAAEAKKPDESIRKEKEDVINSYLNYDDDNKKGDSE